MYKAISVQLMMAVCFLSGWSGSVLGGVTLISSDQMPASHPTVRTVEYFGQLVSQRTNGEITVTVRPEGQLGSEMEALKAVREGRQAMARVNLGLLDNLPAVKLASLPYLFRSSDHMWKVLKGPFGARLDKEMEQAGYIRLMYLDSAPRDFYCTKPIKSQADFAGLRIRVLPSAVFEELIRNLGAQPVALSFNKVGEAFQTKQLDCADGGIVNFVQAQHYKFTPYLMQDEHLLMPEVALMSKRVWDALTPAQRDILRKSANEGTDYMNKLWKDEEANDIAAAKKAGVTVIPRSQISMTAIEAQAIKTYNKYLKSNEDLETVMKIVTTK